MPSAGVYKKEVDLSLYIEISSELKVGMVGPFMKGTINERTLVTNLSSLEIEFGPSPIDDDVKGQCFYAAREYLRNGNQLYLTRIESSATPATFSKVGLRGTSDDSIALAADGVTSIPATRTLTSATGDFVNDGVLVGDVVEVNDVGSPGDNGFYVVTIVAATVLTVDRDWPAGSLSALDFTVWSGKLEGGTDGATSVQASRTFTSAGSTFSTNGVQAGDILYINDTGDAEDNGWYTILSVTNDTTLVLDRDWPEGELSTLTFTVYGALHPAGSDGSTAVAGEFSSATSTFQDHGAKAGDLLIIEDTTDTGNNGTYLVTGLKTAAENTTLEVNNTAWAGGSLTGLTFRVVPGVITLQGLTEGTWLDSWTASLRQNAGNSLKFDLELLDTGGFSIETVFTLDIASVASEVTDNSTLVSATVIAGRSGPGVTQTQTFADGNDGTTGIVDSDLLGSASLGTGLQSFRNIEEVEVDLLEVPGYFSQAIGDGLVTMAEVTRGDCMCIVDSPDFPTVNSPQDVIDWSNGTGGFGRTTALNSSHAVLYWPWVKISDPYYDDDRYTTPGGHAAGVWAQSENQTKLWFAPAGTRRGKVGGAADLRTSPDQGERNAMQVGENVNPISKFIRDGVVIYGQKTLLRTNSALNRIGVRRMLLYAERETLEAVRTLVFDPNDEATDRELVRLVTPLYEFIRDNRGLREFLVLADDTTSPPAIRAQNKLISKIYVKPTTTAEVIVVQFILTPQSADFEELLAA